MSLPDYDEIPGLIVTRGMYDLSRLSSRVSRLIEFFEKVSEKYGENARIRFNEPHDGYPGYVLVTAEDASTERETLAFFGATCGFEDFSS